MFCKGFARRLRGLALAVAVCLSAAPISAQSPGGPSAASVQGGAWHADNTPIPEARLRLRNVVSGRIEATTAADGAGQFVFDDVAEGTYLVELVSERGKVLAISRTFPVVRGQSVATFVRLPEKDRSLIAFFRNASLGVLASAAIVGVVALSPESVTPVSPNR